jgi:ubiquinone biosynthesis protein UbiJ
MISPKTRFIAVGSVMVAGAIAFALFMMAIASKSSDPAELMRIVGQVAGTVAGVGVAVIVTALVKFRSQAAANARTVR